MPSNSQKTLPIHPDIELSLGELGRSFRLGVIVRDADNKKWGLTARHVFADMDNAEIRDLSGRYISTYCSAENMIVQDSTLAEFQIARFRLDNGLFVGQKPSYRITWPIDHVPVERMSNLNVVSTASYDKHIGMIVSSHAIINVMFDQTAEPRPVRGAVIMAPDDPRILAKGTAGTLILSEAGEAIGLAVAAVKSRHGSDAVVCPLEPYLKLAESKLWAPPGSHWTDLDNKISVFLKQAQLGVRELDLGHRPEI